MDYDATNISNYTQTDQRVRFTLAYGERRRHFETTVKGNCPGFSAIDCAISNVYDRLVDESPYEDHIEVAFSVEGNQAIETDVELWIETVEDFEDLVIHAQIVDVKINKK